MIGKIMHLLARCLLRSTQGKWPGLGKWYGICPIILVSLLIFSACREKPEKPKAPRAELQPVVHWLQGYYRDSSPGKGWSVSSVQSLDEQVLVTVAIPPDHASRIMVLPADEQFRIVAQQVCPPANQPVWRLLPKDGRIILLPSVSGQVFIEVVCGH